MSSTNQNINWPSSIASTKHYKTMDFLCICALAINFLLSRPNLILDLNRLIHNLLSSQFHMCRGVSEATKKVLARIKAAL